MNNPVEKNAPVARQDHAKDCEMRHHSCTCGYEAQLEASVAALTAERDVAYAALQTIIDMNVQFAIDRYGDASQAETMACVIAARTALEGKTNDRI